MKLYLSLAVGAILILAAIAGGAYFYTANRQMTAAKVESPSPVQGNNRSGESLLGTPSSQTADQPVTLSNGNDDKSLVEDEAKIDAQMKTTGEKTSQIDKAFSDTQVNLNP